MKRIVTVIAAAMLLAAPVALAQDQPAAPQQQEKQQGKDKESRRQQMSPEERAAAVDKRLERVKSNLKLTSEQAALWPPVEEALRAYAIEAQEARQEMREQREARSKDQAVDPIAMLRDRADRMAERADVMKKLATAAEPLYKTLDDDQKQQLQRLMGAGGNRQGQRPNRPQRG